MLRYLVFPMNGLGSQVPRSALRQIVTRHVHLGTTCLCMWFYYTVRSAHCAQGSNGQWSVGICITCEAKADRWRGTMAKSLKDSHVQRWLDHHSNGVLVHAVVDHVRER